MKKPQKISKLNFNSMKKIILFLILIVAVNSCTNKNKNADAAHVKAETPFVWEAANIYFLLTCAIG